MRPRDRNGVFQPHQFGEHFGAADQWDAQFKCSFDFGVAALHRRRSHNHRSIAQIFGGMADHHLDPAFTQTFDDIAFGDIRTLYRITQIVHHLGNARHADAANADKVDRSYVGSDTLHAFISFAMAVRAPANPIPCSCGFATSIKGARPKDSTRSASS